jgi:hypothetical protein
MNSIQSIVKPISWLALALVLVVPLLFFFGVVGPSKLRAFVLTGTVMWFATAPLWVRSDRGASGSG